MQLVMFLMLGLLAPGKAGADEDEEEDEEDEMEDLDKEDER